MKRKYILITLLVLILAIVLGLVWAWNKPASKVEDEAGITITVDKLCQDFTTNETNANNIYLNKAIQIKGKIKELSQNMDGGTMVVFSAANNTDDVECTLRDKSTGLKVGEEIIVKGFCTGKTITGISLTQGIVVTK
jgi:hypothetical protein